LKQLYLRKKRSWLQVLLNYFKRAFLIFWSYRQYDLVWIEKELFPGVPLFIEKLFFFLLPPFVLDIDDAIHLNYTGQSMGRHNKIQRILKMANIVFAGSRFLETLAIESGAQKVLRIPTGVQPVPELQQRTLNTGKISIGWIGSPSTQCYLKPLIEYLKSHPEDQRFHWSFMGCDEQLFKDIENTTVIPWNEKNQSDLLQKINFGIMPLTNGLFEQGKCSYKILLYFSHGIPALASPVGMNNEVISESQNGFFLDNPDGWDSLLNKVSNLDSEKYKDLCQKAHETSMEYSFEKNFQAIRTQLKLRQD